MISVSKALSIISEISYSTPEKKVALTDARNTIIFSDVISPINMPPFRQSAMDGYALLSDNTKKYQIIGEIKAGDATNYNLKPGQAVRIFTGARVPDNADTIVIQENVIKVDDSILVENEIIKNQNIRQIGEQIQKGETALKKGTKLTPAAIGFLAGIGIDHVLIHTPLKIGILITGNELIEPGEELIEGKIYESNAIQLEVALNQLNNTSIKKYTVLDDYLSTKNTINEAIQNNDLVLISGGISVGDYDFVKEALHELKTEELFYKIKQKPGKPLFFGRKDNTFIFALPGNPASSLTCFYIYVIPLLYKLTGSSESGLSRMFIPIASDYTKKGDRAQFLKAQISNGIAQVLEGQSSAMLHTYAIANALIYIPEHIQQITKGEQVEAILLPLQQIT